jgi:preprotein translocase subunit SecG
MKHKNGGMNKSISSTHFVFLIILIICQLTYKEKQNNCKKENYKNNKLTSYMFRFARDHLQADI